MKKERDARTQSDRDDLKELAAEARALEAKLAAGLTPDDEAEVRARQAFVADRRATLEAGLPFAGLPTGKLEGDLEEYELQREVLWSQLKMAEDDQGLRPAYYRKVKRDFEALADKQATLRTELSNRKLQEANKELAHQAAVRHAERELRAEDKKTISEAEPGRRGTRTEDLQETFAARLALRIPVVEQQLWRTAEQNVSHTLLFPTTAVEAGRPVRDRKLREDEAKIEERIKHEQRRRLVPRGWTFPASDPRG